MYHAKIIPVQQFLSWPLSAYKNLHLKTSKTGFLGVFEFLLKLPYNLLIPPLGWTLAVCASLATVSFASLYNVLAVVYNSTLILCSGVGSLCIQTKNIIKKILYPTVYCIRQVFTLTKKILAGIRSIGSQGVQEITNVIKSLQTPDPARLKEPESKPTSSLKSLDVLKNPIRLPQTLAVLRGLMLKMHSSEGLADLDNHPEQLTCLLPTRQNPAHEFKYLVALIQTDSTVASQYLSGILLLLDFWGITMDQEGILKKDESFTTRKKCLSKNHQAHELIMVEAVISLGECGFGQLSSQLLYFLKDNVNLSLKQFESTKRKIEAIPLTETNYLHSSYLKAPTPQPLREVITSPQWISKPYFESPTSPQQRHLPIHTDPIFQRKGPMNGALCMWSQRSGWLFPNLKQN